MLKLLALVTRVFAFADILATAGISSSCSPHSYSDVLCSEAQFSLSLYQSLIPAMGDEAYFPEYINFDALKSVKSDAIRTTWKQLGI